MRITAIDFETANSSWDSACAVAVVVIENGDVVAAESWLIRPEPLRFDAVNVSIHGIDEDAVRDSPLFPSVWAQVAGLVTGSTIVAHYAPFDFNVLQRLLAKYEIVHDPIGFFCTRSFSRAAFPGWISYSLPVVADSFGIHLDHHDPLSDALAAARIAARCCEHLGADSLEAALESLKVSPGVLEEATYRTWRFRGADSKRPEIAMPDTSLLDSDHPLFGKQVAFTGTLERFTRAHAMQAVADVGGLPGTSVTKRTNYLVVGTQDFSKLRGGAASSKMRRAQELLRQGSDIEIVPENDFLLMLGG